MQVQSQKNNRSECFPQDYKRPAIWVASVHGNVPPHAVCGGESFGNVTYICRVNHYGEIILGKLFPNKGCCYVAWEGCEYAYYEYEVMCNPDNVMLSWIQYSGGDLPLGALQGGCSNQEEKLFIGRKWQDGIVGIGTIVPSHKSLYVSFWGKVFAYCDFEVLVCEAVTF